ncbi:helix-turn-helix domain-containing protein [Rhodoferax sp.]|uniref:AlbA family DNA-binding domain-containing protein n=1 Tax=Rhodoferax sp. TaxID=50421 RepID=UPI0027246A81|nr:ATP-binding protein [Rhodoferax sp.]MDO8320167.1 ATP-binding protein [Rhodoferax sp.]
MSQEGQLLDKKSLRAVLGKTANWSKLAKDCIAFANALGGTLLVGIEDGQDHPPADQTAPADLSDTIRRKLAECTVNVAVFPAVRTAANGGQFIALDIPRAMSVASSTDGRYFLRVADQSKPVTGDDVLRLASERTQATRYFVDPALSRNLQFAGETTLKRIEPHRLAALVLEDLTRYPQSAISDIHQRIGGEIHPKQVKRTLEELTAKGDVRFEGDKRWRRYWMVQR